MNCLVINIINQYILENSIKIAIDSVSIIIIISTDFIHIVIIGYYPVLELNLLLIQI